MHAGEYFGSKARENLIESVLSQFTYFRAFHGCRPFSFESYKRDGLVVLTRQRLANIAFELFDKTIPLNELQQLAEVADLQTRLGNLYFCANAEALISRCGYYLIYGSEALNCLWKDCLSRFHESQSRHREKGTPTVFACDVPLEWLQEGYRSGLVNKMVTHHLQLNSKWPVPLEEWNRNWGFCIPRDLPADYIRNHFHPAIIRDPLSSVSYTNLKTTCGWCAHEGTTG